MKIRNAVLSIAFGLLGGVVSHYAWVRPVHAEDVAKSAPEVVRAQNFVLVNKNGEVEGVFTVGKPHLGHTTVELLNKDGHVIWRAGGPLTLPAGSGASK